MLPKPKECEGCPLYTLGSGFSHPTGSCSTGVLMMGEALGATEAQRGVPFVGEAGAQLNRTLSRTPWTRDDFRLYNVLQCQPPKNWLVGAPWEQGAIEHCRIHRERIITETKPQVILALGGTALEAITGFGEILKRRGYVYKTPMLGDWTRVGWPGHIFQWVIGTYHPSYIMQGNQNLTGIQAFDISRAVEVAKNGWEWESFDRYVERPSLDDIDEFINKAVFALSAGAWLTADIETSRSPTTDEDERMDVNDPITRISFAFEPGYAITIPWQADYLSRIQDILSLSQQYLVFWNADFDVPRLKAHGMKIRQKVVDAMYMWHFLQSDLPKSLGFVASIYTKMPEWKSMSYTAPEYYSCCDADAQIRCTNGIVADLKKQGRFDTFMRHHTELQPILNEMGQSGVLLDQEKRKEFRAAIEEDRRKIDEEIQKAVPANLRPFKPRRKVGSDAVLGLPVKAGSPDVVWGYSAEGEWGESHSFLYNSSQQVLKYIKAQGHPVPRNYKTGKDTTGKDDLESLAKRYPKDPVYRRIIEARELHKVIGQYIDGYAPGTDGRVRTTFTQKPSTWRLASEGPNVQNVRRRWHLANRYREQFVAAPGHVLVEADYRAIEAVLTGFYAGDDQYIRAAKLGVHSILAAHILQHPIRDSWHLVSHEAEVLAGIRDIKKQFKDIYDQAKTIVHLSNYKGSARRIKIEYPELFNSVAEAEKLQRLYFTTIATKVEAWHSHVVSTAAGQSYLDNAFGYRHYFYDVLRYDGTYGTDAKKALAFLPQSTAAAIIKEAILRLAAKDVYRRAMRWQIHDALLFELPNDRLLDARIGTIVAEMTRPIPQLNGLSIDVEVTVGENWGQMKGWQS